jgi:Ca2+-binding RTX toxin-like protein
MRSAGEDQPGCETGDAAIKRSFISTRPYSEGRRTVSHLIHRSPRLEPGELDRLGPSLVLAGALLLRANGDAVAEAVPLLGARELGTHPGADPWIGVPDAALTTPLQGAPVVFGPGVAPPTEVMPVDDAEKGSVAPSRGSGSPPPNAVRPQDAMPTKGEPPPEPGDAAPRSLPQRTAAPAEPDLLPARAAADVAPAEPVLLPTRAAADVAPDDFTPSREAPPAAAESPFVEIVAPVAAAAPTPAVPVPPLPRWIAPEEPAAGPVSPIFAKLRPATAVPTSSGPDRLVAPDRPSWPSRPADGWWIIAGDGDDSLWGGALADDLRGDAGDDGLFGRGGDDHLDGGEGDDHLLGGAGDDRLSGGRGNDVLVGGEGNDTVSGGTGSNLLFGGSGADVFVAAGGLDTVADYQPAYDQILLPSGASAVELRAVDARDAVLTYQAPGGISSSLLLADAVDLDGRIHLGDVVRTGSWPWNSISRDFTISVDAPGGLVRSVPADAYTLYQTIQGGDADDVIVGGDAIDRLRGGSGNDLLVGGGMRDDLSGEAGDDTLIGGSGGDTLAGGAGSNLLIGGEGYDLLVFTAGGNDTVADYGVEDQLSLALEARHLAIQVVDATTALLTWRDANGTAGGSALLHGAVMADGRLQLGQIHARDAALIIEAPAGLDPGWTYPLVVSQLTVNGEAIALNDARYRYEPYYGLHHGGSVFSSAVSPLIPAIMPTPSDQVI